MIKDDAKLELKRIFFEFEEKPVLVRCLKDRAGINIGSNSLSLHRGSEIELPYWIARRLSEEGYVEIKDLKTFDISYMTSLLWDERKSQTPLELDEDFYSIVALQIDQLQKKGSAFVLRDKERMEALLKDIISKRRFKIIKLAQKAGDPSPYIKNLTPEEYWLFKILREQLSEWEQSLVEEKNNSTL